MEICCRLIMVSSLCHLFSEFTEQWLIAVDLTSRVVVFYFSKIRDRIDLSNTYRRTIRENGHDLFTSWIVLHSR